MLLVTCRVLAIELLEIDRVAGAIKLVEMGSFAGDLPGFSYRIAGNLTVAGAIKLVEMGSFAGNLQCFELSKGGTWTKKSNRRRAKTK